MKPLRPRSAAANAAASALSAVSHTPRRLRSGIAASPLVPCQGSPAARALLPKRSAPPEGEALANINTLQ